MLYTLATDDLTMELPHGHKTVPASLVESIDDQVKSCKTELQWPICHRNWPLSQVKDVDLNQRKSIHRSWLG